MYERRGVQRGRERGSERKEGERNSVLFKWESRAQRGKETQTEKPRDTDQKKKRKKKWRQIYFTHGRTRETSRIKERRREEKTQRIFFVYPLNLASFTLMTQRRFLLNSAAREGLMVSFRGSRAEGRNLNALG